MLEQGQLREARLTLQAFLEERFGELPVEVVRKIEGASDLARLRAALRQVLRLQKLEDLTL
jgi:hypothetical protein